MAGKTIFVLILACSMFAHCQCDGILTKLLDLVEDSSEEVLEQKNVTFTPPGATNHPDGFWFGTQDLNCIMSNMESVVSWFRTLHFPRSRRSAPKRFSLDVVHRLVYYRGMVYEWGIGTRGYYMDTRPGYPNCALTWETSPAGHTSCPQTTVKQFVRSYRADYGPYNLITNNCHHFANRVSKLLTSSKCSTAPATWAAMTRRFWRYIGEKLKPHI